MGVVEFLFEENSKVLVEQNGWSRAYAEGYADGEAMRRLGQALQSYASVGIDEWAQGVRAGYFERQRPHSTSERRIEA